MAKEYRTPLDIESFTVRELKDIAFEAIRLVRFLDGDGTPGDLELSKRVLSEHVHQAQERDASK